MFDTAHGAGPVNKLIPLFRFGLQDNDSPVLIAEGPLTRCRNHATFGTGDSETVLQNRLSALLPAKERIALSMHDVPGTDHVCLAIGDCDYVPSCPCESADVTHLRSVLAHSSGTSFDAGGFNVPEGITHAACIIDPHQTTDI